jgi:hypothetical protein
MDALLILAVFVLMAVLLGGCAVVTAIVELIWYLRYRNTQPERSTVSKEMGQLYQKSRIRFWLVCGVVFLGALGLVAHFVVMGK